MDYGDYHRSYDADNTQSMGATADRRMHRYTAYSRRTSTLDEMTPIPESEEISSQNHVHSREGEASLLQQSAPVQQQQQQHDTPSLLRRITRRLTGPRIPSAATLTSAVPLTSLKSLRRPRGANYEEIGDDEAAHENVPIDLSSISGYTFQLTQPQQNDTAEHSEQESSGSWFDQDTNYDNGQTGISKPRFQSFLRRRQVGDGLVVGLQLKRDPSTVSNGSEDAIEGEMRRKRTVRDVAQNQANQRKMIVAVNDAVDLSFLEGNVVRRDTHQSFETMMTRSGTAADLPPSYFFPTDPNIPNWRPITMSMPYILFLGLGAFALAGSQEYLYQKSQMRAKESRGLLSFNEVADVPIGAFFVWKYLPTMITIIYAVLFSVMDFDIRRLEPFYQLSRPEGSPASESLNIDHLTMFQYFVPFSALRLGHWTVFFSTIGNIIASTGSPALQNPSVNFETNPACTTAANNTIICPPQVKKYVVSITPVWSRLLSASYVIVGLIVFTLLVLLRRKSGLLSDPKGIAGIASMATKSHILREFKGTGLATRKDIQKMLEHRRFILYQSSIWQGQWNLDKDPEGESERSLTSPHPPMLRMAAAYPFVTAQILCFIAVPIISLTKANVIPNAAPWLPILIATILKLVWSTFEADVRLMEPFYQLSRGNARPENSLTLDYQATIYGIMPLKAALNRHWLLCIVGICSVALDILSVTVSSFSVKADIFYDASDPHRDTSSGDETTVSFWVSVVLSMLILALVIFTTVLTYLRRRHPFLPREPSTIASILAFIYASNMLEDFIDTEKLTNKQMEQKLKKINKRYALGWFKGRDNLVHCAIDQEPMRSRYVHGKPYDQAMAGPVEGFYT